MAHYIYRNKHYSVVPCTEKDIPSHIERVLSYWASTGTNLNTQKYRLKACVDADEAFKVLDDTGTSIGCLYWMQISKREAIVYYCWFKNGLALALGQDYAYKHFPYETIYYIPHDRKKIHYKCMLTNTSALVFYKSKSPVPVPLYNQKMIANHTRYFKKLGVKEV